MQVHDRLAGGGTIVDAYVEAVGASFRQQQLPHLGHQVEQCSLLFFGYLKERGDVTSWDDKGMAGSHRKTIEECQSMVVSAEDL